MITILKFSKRFTTYVTTPIFYVNDKPHIGHLYTIFLADAVKKWLVSERDDVLLITGTDEHGAKVQKKALDQGFSPQSLCDANSAKFRNLAQLAKIDFDDFIRTTEERHFSYVSQQWRFLQSTQQIKSGSYEGFYDISEESFVAEKDIVEEGGVFKSVEGKTLERVQEDNYLISFTEADKSKLFVNLKSGKLTFVPNILENEVKNYANCIDVVQ